MTTAALERPGPREEGPAAVGTGREVGDPATLHPMTLAAVAVRPVVVFFAVTGLAFTLASRWGEPSGSAVGSYGAWLSGLFPLPAQVGDAAAITFELLAAGLAAGALLGLALGLALRIRPLARPAARIGLAVTAVAAPVTGLTLYHWLLIRFDTGLRTGAVPALEDWGRSFDRLVLPGLVVGLALVGPVAALTARAPFALGPYGGAAMASPLAERAPAGGRGRWGVPAGVVLAGLVIGELLFRRPGLLALIVTAVSRQDRTLALAGLAVVALVGAGLAFIVDLVGVLISRRRAGLDDPATAERAASAASASAPFRRPSPRQLRLAVSLAGLLALAGVAGLIWGRSPRPDPGSQLGEPLLDGLLGTDRLGRDLFTLAASGLGQAWVAALPPALAAALVGLLLAGLERRLPRLGRLVPGLAVDALWWPLPLLVMVAGPALASGNRGLLDPLVLGLVALGLVPAAVGLAHRGPLWSGTGRLAGLAGLAGMTLFLAPVALSANLVAAFAGFDRPGEPSLGQQLAVSVGSLRQSPWPAVVPAVTLTLLLAAWYHLGSHLTTLAWHRSASAARSHPTVVPGTPGTGDDPSGPTEADGPVDPTRTQPLTDHRSRPAGDAPTRRPILEHTIPEHTIPEHTIPEGTVPEGTVPEGAVPDGAGPADDALTPNYSLQPGLPPPGLSDTIQLPVVRVRMTDRTGDEPPER